MRQLSLAALTCLALSFSNSVHAQVFEGDGPLITPPLRARAHGAAAVTALGARLPDVARQHGLAAEQLRELLLRDDDLGVDPNGRLYFADSHLPDPALAPEPQPGAANVAAALVPLDQTFVLHSRPQASKKIYLDFNGHTTTGTSWTDIKDGDSTFVTPPYDIDGNQANFSNVELERIQYIWQRVTEDYAPFDVDVTTEDPGVDALRYNGVGDVNYGIRVCIGGASTDWYATAGYGGVAYIGSFDWNSDTPCYVWPNNLGNGDEKYVAEAVSHEVGHTLDLYHDGTSTVGYYTGHGSGADGWAPIMGVGYYQPVVQFSRGEYTGANNLEDDLAKITASYNIPYIADDHGNSIATATALPDGSSLVEGLIERNTDVDYFRFTAGAGTIQINIGVDSRSPNLNVSAVLYNSAGAAVATSSPSNTLGAAFNLPGMAAGTYYLSVDGVGAANPLNTGYSDYGSIGSYSVSATLPPAGLPVAVAGASPSSGLAPLTVQFSSAGSYDPDGGVLTHAWAFGDGSTATGEAPLYTYVLPGTYTAILTVTDDEGMTASSSVVVASFGPPAAPSGLTANVTCNPNPALGAIALNWIDNSANETSFEVWTSPDQVNWTLVNAVPAITGTSYTDTSLNPSETRYYKVRAVNAYGASAYSNPAGATTYAIPSGVPVLAAAAASASQINLTWNDIAGETDYRIERSTNGTTWTQIAVKAANSTSHSDTGLVAGRTYSYRIRAAGNCGYLTAYSGIASATTLQVSPAAPTALTAKAASRSQINLTWTDASGNEQGFYVERSLNGTSWTRIATLAANTQSYASTGLTANTTYYYRVQAYNAAGVSAYTATASAKTRR